MEKYKYTKTWFLNSEIRHLLHKYLDTNITNKILEIGCYEGLSSIFFADNFIDNEHSSLTLVDPFLNINNNDHSIFLQNNEELTFDYNLLQCNNQNKIIIHKITSDTFFLNNTNTYNFIYIDGSHEIDQITKDMENSFNILEKNGIMWMDDYGGNNKIYDTMNVFLKKYETKYELLHSNYQLAIKKI